MPTPLDRLLSAPQETIERARAVDLERLRDGITSTLRALREARITADSRPSADNVDTANRIERALNGLLEKHPRESLPTNPGKK